MGAVVSYLSGGTQNKMVDKIVDATNTQLLKREKILDTYYPLKHYDDRNFLGYVSKKIRQIANVVPYGTPIPRSRQGTLQKVTTQLIKIGRKLTYDEETQWQMAEMIKYARLQTAGRSDGIAVEVHDRKLPDGRVVKGSSSTLAKYIFGTIKDLTLACFDTLNVMTWQVVQTGLVNHTDFITNTITTIDWKEAGATYNHFPAALTATGAGPDTRDNIWTDYSFADGIGALARDLDTYFTTTGHTFDMIIMGRSLRNHLLQQESTKSAARTHTTSPHVGTVSPDMLNTLLGLRELPPIMTFDELYDIELADGTITKARFFNEDRYAFMMKEMGERACGVTMESKLGDLMATPKTGVTVRNYEDKENLVDISEATLVALPIVLDPRLLFSRKAA